MTDARLCTFAVGGLLLGIPVADVSEVVSDSEVTGVPLAPHGVAGLLNLRGRIVPAVDVRQKLGLESRPPDDGGVHVIIDSGGERTSLIVDGASDVVTVSEADSEAVPETVSPHIRRFFTSSYQRPDGLLLVLDPALVLTDA